MEKTHVGDLRFEPDSENGAVHIKPDLAGAPLDEQLRATALFEDVIVGELTVETDECHVAFTPLISLKPW